jgi:endonuclease/exonuclease/phosphatase (EEP) superfamily protein YafD
MLYLVDGRHLASLFLAEAVKREAGGLPSNCTRMLSFLRILLLVAAAAVTLPLALGLLAPLHPLFDSFGHFRAHGIAAATMMAVALLLVRAWRFAGGAAALAIAATASLGPALPWPEAPGAGAPLTLIQFNAYFKNESPLKAVDLVRAEAADAVALQEISARTEAIMLAPKPDAARRWPRRQRA